MDNILSKLDVNLIKKITAQINKRVEWEGSGIKEWLDDMVKEIIFVREAGTDVLWHDLLAEWNLDSKDVQEIERAMLACGLK